jgi:undecaprenyl-diphosphatase
VGDRQLGLAVLIALSLSHVAVHVLKRAVARPRPCDANGRALALVELPDPFSFPSGHAAAATAVAGAVSLAHPLVAPALIPLAAVIAYSRVALRVHHVSDVIAGAALGAVGVAAAGVLL